MSIEITLYPAHAGRKELTVFLKGRGYLPCRHLWDWPRGTVNFYWYEEADYVSFDGVEASVYPLSDDERRAWGMCEWAMHTRTRAGASSGDRAQQNETIRAARREFGGGFYNDWHGKNRYTPPDPEEYSPLSRGLYMAYARTRDALSAVRSALPAPTEGLARLEGTRLDTLARHDPTRILYNGLVPFAVASVEHFFGQAFRILLRYDAGARGRLLSQSTRKIEIADALALSLREKSIEDVVAEQYSFQSIASIHKAFSDWFGIDVWRTLRRRRKIGRRVDRLDARLKDLIQFRHGVVHRFEIDPLLGKAQIEDVLDLSQLIIDTFVEYIEKSRGEAIRSVSP